MGNFFQKLYTFKVTQIKIMKEYNAWETCKFDKTQTNDLIQILNVQDVLNFPKCSS